MTTSTSDCGCGCGGGCAGAACLSLPAEFVRVRYYYGQRLGVLELGDQTAYHAGKLAFHNARLHGAGVICGLRAERMPAPGGGASRVLRVRRGAALDGCGREVVVGVDQCIDIGAWYARMKGSPDLAGWAPGSTQTLQVAVRYRECPSDPGPAPRDACGCDSGGCEYGRVREGFELALHVPGGEEECLAPPAMADALLDLLRGGEGAGDVDVDRGVATLVGGDCPELDGDDWLCLASVEVKLDGTGAPSDIGAIDNAIDERLSLLPTAVLQRAVLALAGAASDGGPLGDGPRAGALGFQGTAADAGVATIPITLARRGTPAVDVPLETTTFDPALISVQRLDAGAGWQDVTPAAADIALTAAPAIEVTFPAGLMTGRAYRLVVNDDAITPIADVRGRPLSSQPLVRSFALALSGGTLTIDTAF